MDGLDVRILRHLVWGQTVWPVDSDIRKSYGAIARELAVDEGTVRNRVRGFHESGFIRAWRTVLNPTVFGGGEIVIWLDVGDAVSKDDVLEATRLLPGVTLINCFHGKGMAVVIRYRDEAEVKRELDLLVRVARPEWRVIGRVPFPSCELRLSAADRAILRSLQEHPRRPAATVARELGLSTRTIRRRLQRMVAHRAVFALPALDPKAVSGTLMAGLFMTFPADRRAEIDAAVASHLEEHLWHTLHLVPFIPEGLHPCHYNLFLPNLAKVREVLRWAHDLSGVALCRTELFEDVETRFEVFDRELGERRGTA